MAGHVFEHVCSLCDGFHGNLSNVSITTTLVGPFSGAPRLQGTLSATGLYSGLSSGDLSQFRTLQNANKQLAALKLSGKKGGNSDHED